MATQASDTTATRVIVERFYDAAMGGDFDTALALLHEEFELIEPPIFPFGGVYRGVDAFTELLGKLMQLVDAEANVREALIVEGDRAVGIFTIRTRNGELAQSVEDVTVRDGKLARVQVFFHDPTPVLNAAVAAGIS